MEGDGGVDICMVVLIEMAKRMRSERSVSRPILKQGFSESEAGLPTFYFDIQFYP
jgi:hypothetical protein